MTAAILATELSARGRVETRPGDAHDVIGGKVPLVVATPADAGSVADIVGTATAAGCSLVARGRGTKMDWGAPPLSADVLLDLSGLDRILEHSAGDLVVRAQPGVLLADLQAAVAPAGQRLGIDEMVAGSTIGGVVATGLSGPRRLAHGAVRDLLIGVTVVRADGIVATSGGKVVKNVAGYDLGKLYTGSYGTLGVIIEAIFRLHPIPDRACWVTGMYDREEDAAAAGAAVAGSQVVPAAVELDRPHPDGPIAVAALLEGTAKGVEQRAARTLELLGNGSPSEEPPPWWAALPDGIVLKVAVEPASMGPVLAGLAAVVGPARGAVRGSVALGLLHVGLPAGTDRGSLAELLERLRRVCADAGGTVVVLRAPAGIASGIDVWGPVDGLSLMRRLKDNFDPDHRLAPGRFVGGM